MKTNLSVNDEFVIYVSNLLMATNKSYSPEANHKLGNAISTKHAI